VSTSKRGKCPSVEQVFICLSQINSGWGGWDKRGRGEKTKGQKKRRAESGEGQEMGKKGGDVSKSKKQLRGCTEIRTNTVQMRQGRRYRQKDVKPGNQKPMQEGTVEGSKSNYLIGGPHQARRRNATSEAANIGGSARRAGKGEGDPRLKKVVIRLAQ